MANLFRKQFPGGRIILLTWLFDYPYKTTEEWEGLSKAFAKRPEWVDYIMTDAHESFPKYPLVRGVPGGLPLLNSPEISMWGMIPYGGFGANPFPGRIQRLWNEVKMACSGGFPYLEGLYADIDQVLCGALYWCRDRPAADALREYIAFEFSPQVVAQVLGAIDLLDRNHWWSFDRQTGSIRGTPKVRAETQEALSLLEEADRRLPSRIRSNWRWRILYLRALLDDELTANNNQPNARCEEAFNELTRIYCAENAQSVVRPPSRHTMAHA